MKAQFYLCLAGGRLGLRFTSVEISRRRCSNVRCSFGTMALGGVAFAAIIWLAPNKAHHNMAGWRFNTVQRPVIIASLLLKWLSICKNEFSHMWSQTVLYLQCTYKHKHSSGSVELFDSICGMRSTKQSGTLLWCVPPAQSTYKEVFHDKHNLQQASF